MSKKIKDNHRKHCKRLAVFLLEPKVKRYGFAIKSRETKVSAEKINC